MRSWYPTLIVNTLTRLSIVRPWNVVWNGTPGGLRGSPWLLDIHIDPDVVYQARPTLSLSRKVREGPADVVSIHETLTNQILLFHFATPGFSKTNTGAVLGLQISYELDPLSLFWSVRWAGLVDDRLTLISLTSG